MFVLLFGMLAIPLPADDGLMTDVDEDDRRLLIILALLIKERFVAVSIMVWIGCSGRHNPAIIESL
jgi:hypothetical protein